MQKDELVFWLYHSEKKKLKKEKIHEKWNAKKT